jgi:ferric-dicitrate binding protein FerR (iron transport regulator)
VSDALRRAGAEVIAVDDLGKLESALAGILPGSLDGYVQMPVQVEARGDTVVERVRHFLEDGLLARFAAASAILPAMSDEARVVLVGGNTFVEASAPDDHSARLGLLNVLADAFQADKSATKVQVQVLPHGELPERIGAVALGAAPTREQSLADLMAQEPKMSFDEWRIEVMGLVNGEF